MDQTAASEAWVSIKEYKDAVTVAIAAGALAALEIPYEVTDEVSRGNGYQLRVPSERADDARSALAENPVPDSELTQLALQDPPPDDFDPAGRPDSQAHRLAVMMPVTMGVMFLLSVTVFVMSLVYLHDRGAQAVSCPMTGCRTIIPVLLISGCMTLFFLLAVLGRVLGDRTRGPSEQAR